MTYQPRTYRSYTSSKDLVSFRVTLLETDLFISCDRDLSKEAKDCIKSLRETLKKYIKSHPDFQKSLRPIAVDSNAAAIIKDMSRSAKKASVGPMAAIAGCISEAVGRELLKYGCQVIVENGGDIFLSSKISRTIGIYAGKSKFSEKLAIRISSKDTPCGVCTSSGSVGHSMSFGKADAVVVVSRSTSLADACATSICNRVQSKGDVNQAISFGKSIEGVKGILIVMGDILGAWGKIKLVDM